MKRNTWRVSIAFFEGPSGRRSGRDECRSFQPRSTERRSTLQSVCCVARCTFSSFETRSQARWLI